MSLSRPFLSLSRQTTWWAALAPKSIAGSGAIRPLATSNKPTIYLNDLVDALVAEDHGLDNAKAKRIVVSLFDHITQAVVDKKKVSINNVGTFETITTKARQGRNPYSGEPLQIPAKERVKFTAFKHFKEIVNK